MLGWHGDWEVMQGEDWEGEVLGWAGMLLRLERDQDRD